MAEEQWLVEARHKIETMPQKALDIRERAKTDLMFYAKLMNPGYMYGSIHREVFAWMQEYELFGKGSELTGNKLLLLPRAHLKSHCVAVWVSWIILRHPEVTILYVSATAELAQTQLFAIQNIIGSSIFSRFFPEYIHPQEGKRERWSTSKLSVDHPKRSKENIRDATITTAGLTTNTTGWHADIIAADDLVVPENAYTEDGRLSVSRKSSQFTSIRNPGGFTMACGTRYHPKDIYYVWKEQIYNDYDDQGLLMGKKPVWEIKEHVVEEDGIFLWPRVIREDGKAYGFNLKVLARIEAEYDDKAQFFAQYYNNPNDSSSDRISREKFQYYSPKKLSREGGKWRLNGRKLNVYAAVDFAYSLSSKADYTAIVVIGIDSLGNIYLLEMDRFRSSKTYEYFQHITVLHSKWGFKKLRAEVSVAQQVIVNSIKDHLSDEGLSLPIDEYRPTRTEGSKEERIQATLEHRYEGGKMWHLEGGWTSQLEDELVQARPPHDDLKDALASSVGIAIKPKERGSSGESKQAMYGLNAKSSSRFGGWQNRS